jgi:ribosome-binding factor A
VTAEVRRDRRPTVPGLPGEPGQRAPGHRGPQLASLVQRIVQTEIQRGLSDPRVRGLVTVIGVDLSPDLEDAAVRVSVLPAEFGPLAVQALQHAAAHLRRAVLEGSRVRHAPRLRFVLDDSLKRAAALDAAMRTAAEDAAGTPDESRPDEGGEGRG